MTLGASAISVGGWGGPMLDRRHLDQFGLTAAINDLDHDGAFTIVAGVRLRRAPPTAVE
jgi:hypothetical protein